MRLKMRQKSAGNNGLPGGFSVASYNIHKYVGIDGVFDPERVTQVIKELKAEIVGLQEIDSLYYKNENLAGVIIPKSRPGSGAGPDSAKPLRPFRKRTADFMHGERSKAHRFECVRQGA